MTTTSCGIVLRRGMLGCEECEIPEKAFLLDQISCKWLKVRLKSAMRRSSKYLWALLDKFGFGGMRWFTEGFSHIRIRLLGKLSWLSGIITQSRLCQLWKMAGFSSWVVQGNLGCKCGYKKWESGSWSSCTRSSWHNVCGADDGSSRLFGSHFCGVKRFVNCSIQIS
jgi:hypothetical protein